MILRKKRSKFDWEMEFRPKKVVGICVRLRIHRAKIGRIGFIKGLWNMTEICTHSVDGVGGALRKV